MGEAVKRQDYKLPELTLSDRAHRKTLPSAIALSSQYHSCRAIAHIGKLLSSAIAHKIPCKSKINPGNTSSPPHKLMQDACNWVEDYLKYNSEVEEGNKYLCDGISQK